MKEKKNILVFPCGSEIGLEVYRSLAHSTYFNLVGGSSVDNHGRFVYENYVPDIPYVTDPSFIPTLKRVVEEHQIDAIYPATDLAITYLKRAENELGCKVLAPCIETVELCLSKRKTYEVLQDVIPVPHTYHSIQEISHYPVFGKHDVGHSAIGTQRLDDERMVINYMEYHPDAVICDYLSGDEYTVDCFSNSKRELLFIGARKRARISNGISVNTKPYEDTKDEFRPLIEAINVHVAFQGAWFAQFKRDVNGKLVLLEIAARFGGSSSLFRAQGVNFAQLTLFDAFGYDVSIVKNSCNVEMDRAYDNVYKIDIDFDEVYVDYDDCLVFETGEINSMLVGFLYKCLSKGKKLTLLTKHSTDIYEDLKKNRLLPLFDRIMWLKNDEEKSDYIDNAKAIFIDDSYAERQKVHDKKGLCVFGVDAIGCISNM